MLIWWIFAKREGSPSLWGHMWQACTRSSLAKSNKRWRRKQRSLVSEWWSITAPRGAKKCWIPRIKKYVNSLLGWSMINQGKLQTCFPGANKFWGVMMGYAIFSTSCGMVILRRGGPQLKQSQVYPKKYGRRFEELHCSWVVSWQFQR